MGSELGNITGRMAGRVIRGEDIERVLAAIPEQTWTFDEDVPSGVTSNSTIDYHVDIPMRVRREIVAQVLAVIPD